MCRTGRELTIGEEKGIKSLVESELKSAKVAQILHLTASTISRFLKRFRNRGSVENKHRSGLP